MMKLKANRQAAYAQERNFEHANEDTLSIESSVDCLLNGLSIQK